MRATHRPSEADRRASQAALETLQASACGALAAELGVPNSRNPRHFDTIEGGRVYQALHIV